MGNSKTTVSSHCHQEDICNTSLGLDPTSTVHYDPAHSHAVCIGVGQQINLDTGHLGDAADNDAIQIQRVLIEEYSFYKEHTILLTSGSKPPTHANIKAAISESARKVETGGVLLVHFSGHCSRLPNSEEAILIPTDYDQSRNTVVTSEHLTKCMQGTKASSVVIILDCCHSGQIAKQLVYDWKLPGTVTHILVSCSSEQKSLSFRELQNGIFTYFLVRFLRGYDSKENDVPTALAMEHCKPLCEAVTLLMNPAYDGRAAMQPGIWITADKLQYLDEVDRSVTSYAEIVEKYGFLNKYCLLYRSKAKWANGLPPIPVEVEEWLTREAKQSLFVLKNEIKDLSTTLLVILCQSLAKLLYETAVKNDSISEVFQGVVYLSAVSRLLELIDSVDPTFQVDISALETALMQYIVKIKVLTNVSLRDSHMDDLVWLTSVINQDIKIQQTTKLLVEESQMHNTSLPGVKSVDACDMDSVDGLLIEETYARLDAIDDCMEGAVPAIPRLEA